VILDRELAAIYGVETRSLNQAVKRNGQLARPADAPSFPADPWRRVRLSLAL
jgi:hypothetical protein